MAAPCTRPPARPEHPPDDKRRPGKGGVGSRNEAAGQQLYPREYANHSAGSTAGWEAPTIIASGSPAPIGSAAELREFIAEHLALAVVHVEHGVDYATVASDFALGFALKAARAYLDAAEATYHDLLAHGGRNGHR